MKTFIILSFITLVIGAGWAQNSQTTPAPGQDKAINLQSDDGNPSEVVKPVIKDKPIVPSEKKLEVIPIPGKIHRQGRKAVWGSAVTSGAPTLKKPLTTTAIVDRQKILKKFAGAPVIRMPEKR